jgi:microcystin-dependent protein
MSQPHYGEIRLFAGNFAPAGWMFCEGQLLPISENDTLFVLLGTTYGGDGQSTFALPDLRGRVPIHQGQGPGSSYVLGESGGVESVTLTTQQIPIHSHAPLASNNGSVDSPTGNYWATSATGKPYGAAVAPFVSFNAGAISPAGGSQPHENLIPYLCINYIISLFGVFPSNQ